MRDLLCDGPLTFTEDIDYADWKRLIREARKAAARYSAVRSVPPHSLGS